MRILHVNKYLYRRGGAEAYMLDLAEMQAARGDEVAFFGMRHPDNDPMRYAGHFPPQVELEPPPESMADRARAVARMFWSPSSRAGMAAVLAEFEPDAVHLHNVYHQLSPSILAPLRDRSTRVVMTLHDYKLVCPSYRMLDHGRPCDACLSGGFRQAARRRCKDDSLGASAVLAAETWWHRVRGAYDRIDTFVSPSRFLADVMRRGGIEPGRLVVVAHPVRTDGIAVKDRAGGDVVFAGRLSAEKGVDILVDAVGRRAELRLIVAGEGPAERELRARAERVAPGQVQFLGRLGKDRLLETMRSASCVVVPSTWFENQPMTVLEAFACAVPVVASDLGGLPELVESGVDGLVVPTGDPEALATALATITADPDRALAMGRSARAKAERTFGPERHLAALDEIYRTAPRVVPITVA
jgi:glycosyltransferase involved in cell wall biosynthesis